MDVITTSLEALIQRATNPQNQKLDTAAIDAFCVILSKETDGVQIASKLIATHIQSTNEKESLQALILLDSCMKRCGRNFHAEVGKFRFLNEMIKLVSPKYLGSTTPSAVREKVLELLHTWTEDYPREVKINEAYQMLKKQGVVKNDSSSQMDNKNYLTRTQKTKSALFEDEETAKLLQELLQSKDPFELQLANRLIKSMVKDDEKRVQQTSQRNMELESAHNNIKLLSEMLDSYNSSQTNSEDVELIKELYQTCERFKPTLLRLADETQDSEEILGQVLNVNDELSHVFEKYSLKLNSSETLSKSSNANNVDDISSLLDFSYPTETASSVDDNLLKDHRQNTDSKSTDPPQSDMEILNDIFSSIGNTVEPPVTFDSNLLLPNVEVMQPIQPITSKSSVQTSTLPIKVNTKAKALEDLNEIGKSLLQQSLSSGPTKNSLYNSTIKETKSLNEVSSLLPEHPIAPINSNTTYNFTEEFMSENLEQTGRGNEENRRAINDFMTMLKIEEDNEENIHNKTIINNETPNCIDTEIKPLSDIHVTLEDIKPSSRSPITVINDKNSISLILNFADGSPRPDISVIVVTTMSKNSKALTNYLFQAVIPKTCKCRLQQPSGTELPAQNLFLPPAAITQIMLIANPNNVPVSLKFMLSYTMDGETFTEMGEVENLFN
ncbi:hypothetical protein PV326_013644 [Microctonus aethiopoides]|nr:hypothetical protein PV326_013644 [Microctonus aethiopoides]